MNGFDLSNIDNCYIGSTPVSAIYLGDMLVWPKSTPPTPPHDYSQDYFTMEVVNDGALYFYGWGPQPTDSKTISYRVNDSANWTTIDIINGTYVNVGSVGPGVLNNYAYLKIGDFVIGDKISIKSIGWNLYLRDYEHNFYSFIGSADIIAYGNVMSLLYGDNFTNKYDFSILGDSYSLNYLFQKYNANNGLTGGGGDLISVENLILPATTLAESCYESMFYRCTGLTTAPNILPATTLAFHCYQAMFMGCTCLTNAPELPATTLSVDCYNSMFMGCTSLTNAPELPATTLVSYCYDAMFKGCTSLTNAPELPATTLAGDCYFAMFQDCTSLTNAPELPATTLAYYCYESMFSGCTSLTNAPELPATTLVSYCYYNMFLGCTSLNSITCYAQYINANSCLDNWLTGVSATGTFYKDANTTYPSGDSGIPSGWTIVNL